MLNPVLAAQLDNPMVRLDAVVAPLRAEGRPVFDLGVGDPQEPTPKFILEALHGAVPSVGQYPRVVGTPELRASVAGYLQRRFGVAVSPDTEVLPSAGSKEAIFHLALLLVDPSSSRKVVLYPDPGYNIYERGAAFAQGEPHALALTSAHGHLADLDALDPTLLDRTAIFWLCSPQNPTGSVAPRSYLTQLANLSARHGFVIASDECYADLFYAESPLSLLQITRDRAIAFHSLSKRSGMTGIRSGFMAGDPALITGLKRLRPNLGTASPVFVQAAATAAWSDDAHVAERRVVFAEKRRIFAELLAELGLRFTGEAGLYLWIDVGGDDERFAQDLAQRAGIILQPGSFLGEQGRGFVRLSLSPTVERCWEAAAAWRSAARQT